MRPVSRPFRTPGPVTMTHEELVLQQYPRADATHVAPIYLHGEASVFCPEEWSILDLTSDQELGHGLTELAAWEDAAKNIGQPEEKAA
jgi:hypothetical protein